MGLPCANYISPCVVTTERLQISVKQKLPGKLMTPSQCKNQNIISAAGAYLAKVHQCSRKFKVNNPHWITEYKQPQLPTWHPASRLDQEDDLKYGLNCGPFHPWNYLVDIEESKSDDVKIACFSFDEMRPDFFLQDVGTAMHGTLFRAENDLKLRKKMFRWFLSAYVKQTQSFGYPDFKVSEAEVLRFCSPQVRSIMSDETPSSKAASQAYVERMKAARSQK